MEVTRRQEGGRGNGFKRTIEDENEVKGELHTVLEMESEKYWKGIRYVVSRDRMTPVGSNGDRFCDHDGPRNISRKQRERTPIGWCKVIGRTEIFMQIGY